MTLVAVTECYINDDLFKIFPRTGDEWLLNRDIASGHRPFYPMLKMSWKWVRCVCITVELWVAHWLRCWPTYQEVLGLNLTLSLVQELFEPRNATVVAHL